MIDWLASAITGHLYLLLLTRFVGIIAGYYFPCLYISSWRLKGVVDVWQNSAILRVFNATGCQIDTKAASKWDYNKNHCSLLTNRLLSFITYPCFKSEIK